MKMKAVVYEKNGAPHTLLIREVDRPLPQEHEVLVKVHAVSINAADYRSMRYGIIPKRKIFGADIAGQVVEVGKGCEKFKVGDEVFGDLSACGFGGLAEYAAAPENLLAFKPPRVSFEDAAAVPMAALTALQALRDKGKLRAGQKVLICGAGGGVGTFAVHLAKYFGAEVTAVCGPKNVDMLRSLGTDHVLDYTCEDFTKSDQRYHLILGVNGGHPLRAYKRLLTPDGVFVMVGGDLSQVIKTILFGRLLSLGSQKMVALSAKPNTNDLDFIIHLVEAGKIKPVIDRRYPLEQTAEAVQTLSQGHARGKVIIHILPGAGLDTSSHPGR